MARINLLPWRDERRKERQNNFMIALAGTAVLAVLLILVRDLMHNRAIDHQQSRNQFLQTEIDTLDARIKEINELKSKKAELLARMEVIQNLQGNRPVIVRVFDELVRVLPKGIYFTSLTMAGDRISIQGVAESNNRISRFMRQLDESDWFDDPNLTAVRAVRGSEGSTFDLNVQQVAPGQQGEHQGEQGQ